MNLLHCIAHSLPRLLHYTADLILNIELNYMFTRDQVMTITYRAPPRPSSPVRRRPPTHSESSLEELDGSISSGDSERRRRLLRDLPGARLPCNSQQSQIWRPSTGDTLKPKAHRWRLLFALALAGCTRLLWTNTRSAHGSRSSA